MTPEGLWPSDAREILLRALALAAEPAGSFVDPAERSDHRKMDQWAAAGLAATTALELGAWLAAAARDPELLPLVLRALDAWTAKRVDRPRYVWHPFAVVVRELLHCGAEVTPEVRALARHPEVAIRDALVEGLERDPIANRDLLERLAADPEPQVRRRARVALRGVSEPPWWAGVFPRDPVPLLSTEEAARLGPTLARWAELRSDDRSGEAALEPVLDELPDVLAADVLPGLLDDRALHPWRVVLRRMARLPAWGDLFAGVLIRAGEPHGHWWTGALADCEEARSASAARALLRAARARPSSERSPASVRGQLACAARHAWPEGADATDDLAAWLAEEGWVRRDALDDVVPSWVRRSPACVERYRDEVVEAWLRDPNASPWRALHGFAREALRTLPLDARRAAARRALASEDPEVVAWGIEQLLGQAHDPAVDLPTEDLLDALLADERLLRSAARSQSLVAAHAPRLRAALHQGRLDPEGAMAVVQVLAADGELMGMLEEVTATPPPAERRLSDEDLAAWRRIRDAAPWTRLSRPLLCLPVGPLAPEDRPFLERALASVRAGAEGAPWTALALARALAVGGTADDLPILDELALVQPWVDERPYAYRQALWSRLGRPGRPGPPRPRTTDEWMDED